MSMLVKCIEIDKGITIGKKYEVLGCGAEYITIINDFGERSLYPDGFFQDIKAN